ncbi:YeeE/YedE family protein [Glaciecola petra]|uniref:YeeE/YedE family protein n=1 Tax=Glaciecola petra TaxID=3075602 RepID=A0ABU2ZUE2_9ALTE|nr:YeeE/YedE family protein [Aestuariibacter sp. P117]MDT0596268.1 YeeE/YedE family protein [Aestuariibacter sp. P117]
MNYFFALLAGLGFGLGLTISGMVDPLIVLAFLDVAGKWDPSLLFVMGGALVVFTPAYQLVKTKMSQPLFAEKFYVPSSSAIDKPLIIGAIIFGLGWGISGICPGPAVANITGFEEKIFGFILAMIVGMITARRIKARRIKAIKG